MVGLCTLINGGLMVGLCTLILWGTDGGSMYADIMGD